MATPPHNFNGFAGLGLGAAIGPPQQSNLLSSNPPVDASCQKIIASLPQPLNSTSFGLSLCSLRSNGTANYGDESSSLAVGQLVWSVALENWPWATSGAFIELVFTLSVPTGRQVSQTSASGAAPVVLGLGVSGSYAVFSTKVSRSRTGRVVACSVSHKPIFCRHSSASVYLKYRDHAGC